MPEGPEPDGTRILSEEQQEELRRIEDARASLETLLEHERKRRRNRWIFFGGLLAAGLAALPLIVLYMALLIKLALSVA